MTHTDGGKPLTAHRVPVAPAFHPEASSLCPCGRPMEFDVDKHEPFCRGCGRSDACVCRLGLRLRPGPLAGAH